jgi:hypothetical protein
MVSLRLLEGSLLEGWLLEGFPLTVELVALGCHCNL